MIKVAFTALTASNGRLDSSTKDTFPEGDVKCTTRVWAQPVDYGGLRFSWVNHGDRPYGFDLLHFPGGNGGQHIIPFHVGSDILSTEAPRQSAARRSPCEVYACKQIRRTPEAII
jgi:hypothetical protein